MKSIPVNVFDPKSRSFMVRTLNLEDKKFISLSDSRSPARDLYIAPGFIDAHAHVYPGATCLGISADRIGLKTGVHLVIDAGSAGSAIYDCFRDYVLPTYKTDVKAYLNISRIGLVTKQPYSDPRHIDIESAVNCFRSDNKNRLLGIKVMSSGIIVEDAGMTPIENAVRAAEILGCRIMAHLVEGPPSNENTMHMLRRGDIITHCFHGKPNVKASLLASKGTEIKPAWYSIPNIMWNQDGSPTRPLEAALSRGVLLDVGHGAASFDQFVARSAINAGLRQFAISTDAHIRNIDQIVLGLPQTMSKFLSLGMTLAEVVASVTVIPADQHGIYDWCEDLSKRATIFRIRKKREDDPQLIDSNGLNIEADQRIEPVAVVTNKDITDIITGWEGY